MNTIIDFFKKLFSKKAKESETTTVPKTEELAQKTIFVSPGVFITESDGSFSTPESKKNNKKAPVKKLQQKKAPIKKQTIKKKK